MTSKLMLSRSLVHLLIYQEYYKRAKLCLCLRCADRIMYCKELQCRETQPTLAFDSLTVHKMPHVCTIQSIEMRGPCSYALITITVKSKAGI